MKGEKQNANSLLEGRENELNRERADHRAIQRKLESELQLLREQYNAVKEDNDRISRRSS